MSRYVSGDAIAFIDLYKLLAPRLRRQMSCAMRDEGLAEDLVQRTFLQIHRASPRFTHGAPLGPWVATIARNLLLDELRRAQAAVANLDAMSSEGNRARWEDSPEAAIDAKDLAARLETDLRALPATQRQAFRLVRQHGMSLADASRHLGVSVNAIKVRVHRACNALREGIRTGNRAPFQKQPCPRALRTALLG